MLSKIGFEKHVNMLEHQWIQPCIDQCSYAYSIEWCDILNHHQLQILEYKNWNELWCWHVCLFFFLIKCVTFHLFFPIIWLNDWMDWRWTNPQQQQKLRFISSGVVFTFSDLIIAFISLWVTEINVCIQQIFGVTTWCPWFRLAKLTL